MKANFLIGRFCVTKAARAALNREPIDLLARHGVNEHGFVTPLEAKRNALAMRTAGQIVSRYYVDPTTPARGFVLIVTEEGWGRTVARLERKKPCSSSPSSAASSAPTPPCAQS